MRNKDMESSSQELVPVFLPALVAILVHEEDKKGVPLTRDEVESIRDKAACIMMKINDARVMDESRGYTDIDPENCWYDWQMTRREMERKPDIDPGPRFYKTRSSDPGYQKTINDAHSSIDIFKSMLPVDGSARPNALIKTKIVDGEKSALMWLNNTAIAGNNFSAEVFELPEDITNLMVGDRLIVTKENVLDWMVNEFGRLKGGYSLRYHRSHLSEKEKREFDDHIGVNEYL